MGYYDYYNAMGFSMMVHAAVSQLYMFGFWYGSAYYLPTAPVDGMPGVFKVDVPEWAMDIVGAEDLDECAESPCEPNAMCYGQAGATAATGGSVRWSSTRTPRRRRTTTSASTTRTSSI